MTNGIRVVLVPPDETEVTLNRMYVYDKTVTDKAKEWAIKMDGMVQEDGVDVDYSSKYYATESKNSETLAQGYAESASSSAGSASDSATLAESHATNAGSSATSASNSATEASGYATTAGQQAAIASQKATEAKGYSDISKEESEQAEGFANDARGYSQSASASADTATLKAQEASDYSDTSKQWAIGEPSEPEGHSAKYWAEQVEGAIPDQTGNSGKVLSTNGTTTLWTSAYGASLDVSIDSSTFVMSASLKDKDGNVLGQTQTIDLPLESVVVNGSYDSTNKKIVLTLQNGNTIDVPVGDLISGLQEEITVDNKLSSDLVDDTNKTNKFVTTQEKTTWNGKQNAINDLDTIRSGASAGASALQPNDNITELNNDAGYIAGITYSMVITALGYTPYNSTNPSGYTSNVGTVTSVNNVQPDANGNVTINAGATYTAGTGIDITNNEISVKSPTLVNTATGTNALTINGTPSDKQNAVNIGYNSKAEMYGGTAVGVDAKAGYNGTAVGQMANGDSIQAVTFGFYSAATTYATAIGSYSSGGGQCSTAIGRFSVVQNGANYAIQLGQGTNSEAKTLYVGFNNANYKLLDGTTGKIPDGRLPIATSASSSSTNAEVVGAKLFYDTCGDIETLINAL